MLEKKCLGVRFLSKACSEQTNHELDRNLYVSPISLCRMSQERLVFHAINPFMTERSKSMDWFLYDIGLRHERVNKYFNSIDKSLIVNC